MAFSLTLKRTFEEVIDVSCSTEQPGDHPMPFRIPAKRQKLQLTPRKLGLEYRELISVEGKSSLGCEADLLCPAATRQQREVPDVPTLRLVTSSPDPMTSPPPRSHREVFPPSKEELVVNPTASETFFFEKQFSARPQTHLALLGQPVAGSACLNLNIPEHQAAAAAAALLTSATSPRRASDVPEGLDDRSATGGFDRRSILPQFFQHPSLLRYSSVFKPETSLCLWQTEEVSSASTNTNSRNGFSDSRRLLDGGSRMRRVGGNGSLGVRSRMSDRVVGPEAELASTGEEEMMPGPVEVCAECQKVFKRKVYLQRHMEREHWLPAKVFKCDDCKYETKHQSNLSVHRRTHTGERPYHCGACGQRYTQGHLLKSHIRSRHAGNLRFYNLDKRSDSTRGRKSLDFKHDIYLSLQPNKDVPYPTSIQAFTYQRERLSSYMTRLANQPPPLTNWDLATGTKMRREWANGASYFALVPPPRPAINDEPFLSTAATLAPFFGQRSVNLSTELPVIQSDLMARLLSTDLKPPFLQKDVNFDGRLSSMVSLSRSMSGGGDDQFRFGNDPLVKVMNDGFQLFSRGASPPQSVPEDLTVTKRRDTVTDQDRPTPTSPDVDGSLTPGHSNSVEVDALGGGGDGPYLRQNLPTIEHTEETDSETNAVEQSDQGLSEDAACLTTPLHHPLTRDEISKVDGDEPDYTDDVKGPEVTVAEDDGHDDVATDLSVDRRRQRRHLSTDVRDATDVSDGRTNGVGVITDLDSEEDDDSDSHSAASASSDTLLPPDRHRRLSHNFPGHRREGEEGSICPHFQKLQEFRRIVLRFVKAFVAPNSLGIIGDKDESFAETDLIDEIVHAAMFNDVE